MQFWPVKLGQWANQSGYRCHMTCKMAGRNGHSWGPAADISSQEGLAHCYVMQNTDINLYFPHAAQWTKNTLHVILLIIPFFLLVQCDGIHFILINHDNFEFILICEWRHSWKSETWLLTDKLDQVTSEVMACLTVKMMPIAEIYPYFPHTTWWKTIHPLKLCEL